MLVGAVMTANISAGGCSAALEAEEELWACSRTAPPIRTLMPPIPPLTPHLYGFMHRFLELQIWETL